MYSFESIVGNEQVIEKIKYSIKNDKVSHAYILSGGKGTGKKLIANVFAKALNCENSNFPCGICSSCKSFETGNNPDILYIKADKAKSIGVLDIREKIIKNVEIKQFKYKYKIFIIENADQMTVQAQNAFLKTLEEPPKYAVFFLLARNEKKFLPTVLSRCSVLKIRSLSTDAVSKYIKNKFNLDNDKSEFFSEYSQGSIGSAIELTQSEEFLNFRGEIINILKDITKLDPISAMNCAKALEPYKDNNDLISIFFLWYRDILSYKYTNDFKYIYQKDIKNIIKNQSDILSEDETVKNIDAVFKANRELKANSNFILTMEVLFLKLNEKQKK